MNLYSKIFPPGVDPARPGLYLTSLDADWHFTNLNYWNCKHWFSAAGKRDTYHMIGNIHSGQNRYWRGLAFDPSKAPDCPTCAAIAAQVAAIATQVSTRRDNSQAWAGMDGAIAFHLIERHAENWADTAKMMEEWLAANQSVLARGSK